MKFHLVTDGGIDFERDWPMPPRAGDFVRLNDGDGERDYLVGYSIWEDLDDDTDPVVIVQITETLDQ